MNWPLRNYLAAAGSLLAIIGVCAIASTMTALWVMKRHDSLEKRDHDWLHVELGLEEGEIPELESLEKSYGAETNILIGEMQVLKAALSNQLLTKSEEDEELVATVREIHLTHGQLQELSIRHYFDMLSILPEAKRRRLRELAVESLSNPL